MFRVVRVTVSLRLTGRLGICCPTVAPTLAIPCLLLPVVFNLNLCYGFFFSVARGSTVCLGNLKVVQVSFDYLRSCASVCVYRRGGRRRRLGVSLRLGMCLKSKSGAGLRALHGAAAGESAACTQGNITSWYYIHCTTSTSTRLPHVVTYETK